MEIAYILAAFLGGMGAMLLRLPPRLMAACALPLRKRPVATMGDESA